MKGSFNITFTAKEALTLLSTPGLPNSLTKKIVAGFQGSKITPVGEKNSVVSRAKKSVSRKPTTSTETQASVN